MIINDYWTSCYICDLSITNDFIHSFLLWIGPKNLLKYFQSSLQFFKLHSWCYHIVSAIQEYKSINSITIKTYKTLYKSYIKGPYCILNKKDYMKQILRMISNKYSTDWYLSLSS